MSVYTNDIANMLIDILKKDDFVIQRYDAKSSNSIYLKLDYGVCNSIRIATHGGKKHLKYRYNIIIGGKRKTVNDTYVRYYYNEKDLMAMVKQILIDRKARMRQYGEDRYKAYMNKNLSESQNKAGFWAQAVLI